MALEWIGLGAKEGEAILVCAVAHSGQPLMKQTCCCETFILDSTVLIARRIVRSGAQLIPEKNVADAVISETNLKIFTVELGMPRAVWGRANVSNGCDGMPVKKFNKTIDRVPRVTDRIENIYHLVQIPLRF